MENKNLENNDNISIFLYVLLVFILGIIAYLFNIVQFVAFTVLILFLIFIVIFKNKVKPHFFIFLYFIFGLSILNCNLQIKDYDTLFLNSPNNDVQITGTISSIPETKNQNRTRFYFEVDKLKLKNGQNILLSKPNKTFVYLKEDKEYYKNLKIGDKLVLKGNFDIPFEAKNPSQFSYRDYLKTKKVFTVFYLNSGDYTKLGCSESYRWLLMKYINDIRDKIIYKHSKYLGEHKLELLGGVVFGDNAINPTEELEVSFLHSGLTHLLAASGLNVGLIFAICFYIFQFANMPYRLNIITNMLIVLLYLLMTGLPVPIIRAAIMLEIVLFGKLINREAKSLNLISFAAFLMLIKNPLLIKDISFQFSFLVALGLIISSDIFVKYCPFKDNLPNVIKADIFAPIVAQIWIFPLQMFYFNSFVLYSIIANILVLPFIAIASFLGFASAFFAVIPFVGDFVLKITDFLLNPLLAIIIKISNVFLKLPCNLITTFKPTVAQICLYYSIILLLFFNVKQKLKLCLTSVFILVLSLTFVDFKPKTLDLITFSVGNSDMLLIKTKKKKYILIDTSKSSYNQMASQAKMVLIKYLKNNNIKNVELIILTHYDNDHAGGLIDIYQNVNVKKTILLKTIHNSQCYNNIWKYIKENDINYEYVKNNNKVFSEDDISFTTFYDKNAIDENDMSIITFLKYKEFEALFMGDASFKTFEVLKSYFPQNINFLKSSHHGAKDTINEKMIEYLNPEIVILSTGKNKYYHPHYSTLYILNKNKINFLRTDYDNAIKIETNGLNTKIFRFDSNLKRFNSITR